MLTKRIRQWGWDRDPVQFRFFQAGSFHLAWDADLGALRHMRLGDQEAVRGIHAVVCDREGRNVLPWIKNAEVFEDGENWRITFVGESKGDGVHFQWNATVLGKQDGRLTFHVAGEALTSFESTGLGLCVLHPIVECAGKKCRVEHRDGAVEEGAFPRWIEPKTLFESVDALRYDPAPGLTVEIRLEGGMFHTDDLRNWGDASFRTSTQSFGHREVRFIEKGTRVEQTVTVDLVEAKRRVMAVVQGRGAQLSIATQEAHARPGIGLNLPKEANVPSEQEAARLKILRLHHLRVCLNPSVADAEERLRTAGRIAKAIATGLQMEWCLTEEENFEDALYKAAGNIEVPVSLMGVTASNGACASDDLLNRARAVLGKMWPRAVWAQGCRGDFEALNRDRLSADNPALPLYALQAQAHLPDNTTLVENLAVQPITVWSVQQFVSRAAVLSPVQLRSCSTSAFAGAKWEQWQQGLPEGADVRLGSLLGATWTLGSLAKLGVTRGVHGLTYYDLMGMRGVMGTSGMDENWPFPSESVYPVWHVFADVAEGMRFYTTLSSHPLQLEGLTYTNSAGQRCVLVANLLPQEQEIRVKTGTCKGMVRILDEDTMEEAMMNPESWRRKEGIEVESQASKIALRLKPFAYAKLTITV